MKEGIGKEERREKGKRIEGEEGRKRRKKIKNRRKGKTRIRE